jgi:uncharacterized damage-inducible protein DinB
MGYTIPEPEQAGHSVLAATFEYNAWANLRLLDYCDGLSDEQLDSSAVGGYGTIRDTLKHMVYAEVDYVTRVNGKEPADPPPWKEFPGFDVLRAGVRWANEELLRLALSAESDTMVVEVFPEGTVKFRLADLMVQAPSHAMEHRTQIASVITVLGMEPPDTSTWAWMEASGAWEETHTATGEAGAS